jgi:PAS domain S-box-containing protein
MSAGEHVQHPILPDPARRRRRILRRLPAYGLAIILPILASIANEHLSALSAVPFALYFISVVTVAALGGMVPAMLAMAFTVLSRNYFVDPSHGIFHLTGFDVARLGILFAAAAFVSLIAGHQRKVSEALEDALELVQDRSNALIESLHASKCASWMVDLDVTRTQRWFDGSYEVFGRPFSEIEPMPSLLPLFHPEDRFRFNDLPERMRMATEPLHVEYRVLWPNGEVHWLEVRATRVPGPRCVWRGVTFDITDRKAAEAAVLRQEKLAATGRLASTVAHEVNNPLEAVANLLYLIRDDTTLSETSREYLATAESELARLSEISRLTLGFARSNAVRRTILVADAVDNCLAIFRQRFASRGIAIERYYQPGVAVTIAPHELRQIVTNLLLNAADAMPAQTGPAASCRIAIHILSTGVKAALLIEDNGSGIKDQDLPRIFEPFFTTKHDVGTGIGLWVTRELVDNNDGQIFVESGDLAHGMRTRFRIELPLATEPPSLEPPSRERPAYVP